MTEGARLGCISMPLFTLSFFMHLVFWVGENIATRLGCAPAGRLGGLGFDVDAISAVGGWGGGCSSVFE